MLKTKAVPLHRINDVAWLSEVREVRHGLDLAHPILVRSLHVASGKPLPQRSASFAEKHPYCEISLNFVGRITQFIGAEQIERQDRDMLLLGPGIPHYSIRQSYPQRSITVYFLPVMLLEMGPGGDGARVLSRFTLNQGIKDRVFPLPQDLAQSLGSRFERMAIEFDKRELGSEFRVRCLLMETLLEVIKWEKDARRALDRKAPVLDWRRIETSLRYMHEHLAEPIYIEQVANAVGLSISRLQVCFRKALGVSCMSYLNYLRISRAKSLLCQPSPRVRDISLATGFETLSHFYMSFRRLVGMSPTDYIRLHGQKEK